MKDIEDVVLAYEEALRLGKVKVSPRMTIPEQVARFRAAQEQVQPVIQQVRLVLDCIGIPLILYPSYIGYALQLNKLCGVCGGEALVREAQLMTGVWAGRGLKQQVLERIRTEVFDIPDLPGPESPLPE